MNEHVGEGVHRGYKHASELSSQRCMNGRREAEEGNILPTLEKGVARIPGKTLGMR